MVRFAPTPGTHRRRVHLAARRLALLARLRRDRSAGVAGAAARVWPPRENDPGFSR